MKSKKTPSSALLLSFSILFPALAPSIPALAANSKSAPGRISSLSRAPINRGARLAKTAAPASAALPASTLSHSASAAAASPRVAPLGRTAAAAQADATFTGVQKFAAALAASDDSPRHDASRQLRKASAEGSAPAAFDNFRSMPAGAMGILPLPQPKNLPQDVKLDPKPSTPEPRGIPSVGTEEAELPGSATPGAIFEPAVSLKAKSNSERDIERALRDLIDSDAAKFGVTSTDLATLHVKKVEGRDKQADTIFAYFRQQKKGRNPDGSAYTALVEGASLSITVKIVNGKPEAYIPKKRKLYGDLKVKTTPKFSEKELEAKARQRLPIGRPKDLILVDRRIIYSNGSWHAANLYTMKGQPIMIAVDVVTGEALAWDARLGAHRHAAPAAGRLAGRGEKTAQISKGEIILEELPMPRLHLTLPGGGKAVTDSSGRVVLDKPLTKPVTLKVKLVGDYVLVEDQAGAPLSVSITLKPGQGSEALAVFNPKGADEFAVAQVNVYYHETWGLDWVQDRIGKDERLQGQTPARPNIDDHGNAYYTPGAPSTNYFRSTERTSNGGAGSRLKFRFTARADVIYHEKLGHYVDDMLGGIVDGGLSEGWGDIMAMYILNSPIIGNGFIKNPSKGQPDHIRNGENTHPYSPDDEVHDQGQVWGGFAWKLRVALLASLKEAGAAVAESLVLPTLYAKASTIPEAMAQVLLNDMDKSGKTPHEAEIRAAAAAHGVTLPKIPAVLAFAAADVVTSAPGEALRQFHALKSRRQGWQNILDRLQSGEPKAQKHILDHLTPGKTKEQALAAIQGKIEALDSEIRELESRYPGLSGGASA